MYRERDAGPSPRPNKVQRVSKKRCEAGECPKLRPAGVIRPRQEAMSHCWGQPSVLNWLVASPTDHQRDIQHHFKVLGALIKSSGRYSRHSVFRTVENRSRHGNETQLGQALVADYPHLGAETGSRRRSERSSEQLLHPTYQTGSDLRESQYRQGAWTRAVGELVVSARAT